MVGSTFGWRNLQMSLIVVNLSEIFLGTIIFLPLKVSLALFQIGIFFNTYNSSLILSELESSRKDLPK